MKLFSVCIPVFNAENYIEETVLSVIQQAYSNIEIIVVDNNSTDRTWEILQRLTKHYHSLNIIRNDTNIGMMPNWNKAISYAHGDYVLLLSADDKIKKGFIEKSIKNFLSRSVDIVTFNHFYLKQGVLNKRRMKLKSSEYSYFMRLVLRKNPFSINFTVFTKRALSLLSQSQNLFKRNLLVCDYDLWFRIAKSGLVVYYDDNPLGIYRLHASNLSNLKIKMLKQTLLIISSHSKSLLRNKFDLRYVLMILLLRYYFYRCRGYKEDLRLRSALWKRLLLGF